MTRILVALLALISFSVEAQTRQYGVATTFEFTMLDGDGLPLESESDGGSEVTLVCDDGTPTTATNDFSQTDFGGYDIDLTAAEMRCANLRIEVAASVVQTYLIETYGSHAAAHKTVVRGDLAQGTGCSTTNIRLDSSASATDDIYNYKWIDIIAGSAAGERRVCTDYNGTTKDCTINRALPTACDATSFYQIQYSEVPLVAADANGVVQSNTVQVSGDATAADNQELFFDDGGFTASNSTIGTVTNAPDVTVATDGIGTGDISSAALAEIAAAVGDLEIEDAGGASYSLKCVLALDLSYDFGEWTLSGTTGQHQDPSGTETRADYDVTETARSGITLTCP